MIQAAIDAARVEPERIVNGMVVKKLRQELSRILNIEPIMRILKSG